MRDAFQEFAFALTPFHPNLLPASGEKELTFIAVAIESNSIML